MRHIVTSQADRPGMTLDQLAIAVEQARRSGATGGEIVRGRLFGRRGALRSITVDLEEPFPGSPDGHTAAEQPESADLAVAGSGTAAPRSARGRGRDKNGRDNDTRGSATAQ